MSKETVDLEMKLGQEREQNASLQQSLANWKLEAGRFRSKYLVELEAKGRAEGRLEQAREDITIMVFMSYCSLFVALAGIGIAIYLYLTH